MSDADEFPPPKVTDAPAAIWLVYGEIEQDSTLKNESDASAPLSAHRVNPDSRHPEPWCRRRCRTGYAFPLTFSTLRKVPRPSMPPSTYISTSVSTSGGAGQPLTAAT